VEINDLSMDENWQNRLDFVFDAARDKKETLTDDEIKSYVDFNKQFINQINDFIMSVKNSKIIYICSPERIFFSKVNDFKDETNDPAHAEVFPVMVLNFYFNNIQILNKEYLENSTFKQRIIDRYVLECVDNFGNKNQFQLRGQEIVEFKNKGSIIEMDGDIIAISVDKAIQELNNYYN